DALLLQARLLLSNPDEGTRAVFAEEAVHQALRFDVARASELIDALDQDRVTTRVLRVRQLLTDGNRREATNQLELVPSTGTLRERVERNVLRALTFLEVDVDRANGALRDALELALPERLIRSIIDPGPDVHKLLMSCTPTSELQPFVHELIEASSRTPAPPRRVEGSVKLVESLTNREVTVLRYLCSRLTYEEIAAALYLSLNTLKTHVKAVYRKLEVVSRADAVTVGRSLRLI
ncbi:MAG TPA: LuxR C-terminal-related transcriptional regulator, partial [Ilumatobacteraceae bacterium]|nr:LuxR C-terminal-related transcriptional regulator [Ilumatobacteraceae bacterium]